MSVTTSAALSAEKGLGFFGRKNMEAIVFRFSSSTLATLTPFSFAIFTSSSTAIWCAPETNKESLETIKIPTLFTSLPELSALLQNYLPEFRLVQRNKMAFSNFFELKRLPTKPYLFMLFVFLFRIL